MVLMRVLGVLAVVIGVAWLPEMIARNGPLMLVCVVGACVYAFVAVGRLADVDRPPLPRPDPPGRSR